ncbi:acyltransferase family protein [Agromyces sp. NDB4Y10]|uniref:acyltransferase family protein n=1 Tax=Agromyces sp. NDB4Y10 TaxID=1775951 RepID=UPI000832923B|nr:acyltransferase family protein [Agromyces sp. NDB4Y10]
MPTIEFARLAAPPRVRSVALDLVRLVGLVAVVLGHVSAEGLLRPLLYSWHVPVFFVISGYLWRRSRPLGDEVHRRTRSLLVPYALWLLIVTAAWAAITSLAGATSMPDPVALLMGGSAIGGQYAAFWFVTALFAAVVAMRALSAVRPWLPAVVGVAAVAVATVRPELVAELPWSVGVGLMALVFLAVGEWLRQVRHRVRAPLELGVVLVVGGLALAGSGLVAPVDLKAADVGTPVAGVLVAAAISCGLILVAESLAHRVPEWLGRAATTVAGVAMPVILGHALVIMAGRLVGAPSLLVFATALAVPILVGLLLARSRAGRILL